MSYVRFIIGGDWEYPLTAILYPDADTLCAELFVPLLPNAWNPQTLMAYGNDPETVCEGLDVEKHNAMLRQLGGPEAEESFKFFVENEAAQEVLVSLMQGRNPESAFNANDLRHAEGRWDAFLSPADGVSPRILPSADICSRDLKNVKAAHNDIYEHAVPLDTRGHVEEEELSETYLFAGPGIKNDDLTLLSCKEHSGIEFRSCELFRVEYVYFRSRLPWSKISYLGLVDTPVGVESAPDALSACFSQENVLRELVLGEMSFSESSEDMADFLPKLQSLVCLHSHDSLDRYSRGASTSEISPVFVTSLEATRISLPETHPTLRELTLTALIRGTSDSFQPPPYIEKLNLYLFSDASIRRPSSNSHKNYQRFQWLCPGSELTIAGEGLSSITVNMRESMIKCEGVDGVAIPAHVDIHRPEGVHCQIVNQAESASAD